MKSKFSSLFQYFKDDAKKLSRKGVFPYDYMDEDLKNKLKKKLPNIKYFNSNLSNTKYSNDDCDYALETYDYFECKEVTDYDDLYVNTDVLSLANVFIAYRKSMCNIYGLDPIYYVSAPGFSNRAMLKMTDAESKLITDVNMHLMIENGVRGARYEPIYYHAKANNEYINLNFTKEKE